MLIKLRLPSSGSIIPWSIILLLLQGTEQGIPSTPGHLESALRADVPGICLQRKPKKSFEKSPKAFVLNGVMVRVWVSLENCGTEILGTVMYRGHICFPRMINVLLVPRAFPTFCDVSDFRKPGGSGNTGLDFGFLPVTALKALLCPARQSSTPVCTSSSVTGLLGCSNRLL